MQKPKITDRPEALEAVVQASVNAINGARAPRALAKKRRRTKFTGKLAFVAPTARRIRQTVKACNRENRRGRASDGSAFGYGPDQQASVVRLYGKLSRMGLVKIVRRHHQPPHIVFMGVQDVTEPLLKAAA